MVCIIRVIITLKHLAIQSTKQIVKNVSIGKEYILLTTEKIIVAITRLKT